MMRDGLGSDIQFPCIDLKYENETFLLKLDGNAPKLDGFIQGQRYRIKTEIDDDPQDEISDDIRISKLVSEIETHLSKSLENLNTKKGEKQLIADFWCHFGKCLVYCVDEGNDNRNTRKM
ncbi:Hypothetical predicted protein [Paramuricea clavata]|uniref:Uncharacterized protein n=1 Tax=Paramuricea clavata TaxID=317549 RepID=A0A6S7LH59_PARCT|nr:Hypothetical predicted protein [Paramuricea clavata]